MKVIEKKYLLPFVLVTSLFALWGLANNMTDTLLAAFKRIMDMARLATLPRQAEWEAYVSRFQGCDPNAPSSAKWQLMERIF